MARGALQAGELWRRADAPKFFHLGEAAARDVRQRRTSERTGQRFTAIGQTRIESRYARDVEFQGPVAGIPIECRN